MYTCTFVLWNGPKIDKKGRLKITSENNKKEVIHNTHTFIYLHYISEIQEGNWITSTLMSKVFTT